MSKQLLTEYFALCDGGVCPDYLTEGEKKRMSEGVSFYMTQGLRCCCREQSERNMTAAK